MSEARPATETISARAARVSGQSPFRCYQCGKCSAGCPTAGKGDLLPHVVFRLLQMDDESVLHALQPWLCVSCQTCMTRCPQEIDLSRVMDFLRAEALRRGTVPAAARRIVAFNEAFLGCVGGSGRLNEVVLGATYNLKTLDPFQNAGLMPALIARGKIRLPGRRVRGLREALARAREKR